MHYLARMIEKRRSYDLYDIYVQFVLWIIKLRLFACRGRRADHRLGLRCLLQCAWLQIWA